MPIAFFDIDKTLISVNSASLWLKRELRGGHISHWQALRGVFWLLLYALGLARLELVIADAVLVMRGKRERDLEARTNAFYHEEVRALLRPGARAAIDEHRRRGDRLYLLTTSSTYLSTLLAKELGFDGYLCNRFEVNEDGALTGRVRPPLCFGPGKVTHAQSLADELGLTLSECSFYTDSYSDLPMMLAVGTPIAVNPDGRLRRFARQRGWRVEDWGQPQSAA